VKLYPLLHNDQLQQLQQQQQSIGAHAGVQVLEAIPELYNNSFVRLAEHCSAVEDAVGKCVEDVLSCSPFGPDTCAEDVFAVMQNCDIAVSSFLESACVIPAPCSPYEHTGVNHGDVDSDELRSGDVQIGSTSSDEFCRAVDNADEGHKYEDVLAVPQNDIASSFCLESTCVIPVFCSPCEHGEEWTSKILYWAQVTRLIAKILYWDPAK